MVAMQIAIAGSIRVDRAAENVNAKTNGWPDSNGREEAIAA